MSSFDPHAWKAVRECGERILKAANGAPWTDGERQSVERALLDRSDGLEDIERHITEGTRQWRDAAAFREWLAR